MSHLLDDDPLALWRGIDDAMWRTEVLMGDALPIPAAPPPARMRRLPSAAQAITVFPSVPVTGTGWEDEDVHSGVGY